MIREIVTDNPLRLGLTPSERAAHVPGTAIKTNGVGYKSTSHINTTRPLSDFWVWKRQERHNVE
jgi:hypothetical protein